MSKERDGQGQLPREVELKKKIIICPKCKTEIEVDFIVDLSPITSFINSFQTMGKTEKDDK